MIAVVDYGMGNLRSVQKALEFVGADVVVTQDAGVLRRAAGVVLPGVGAFQQAMVHLHNARLIEPILEILHAGKPFLGICLGLQLLFETSEEQFGPGPGPRGLGYLRGQAPLSRRSKGAPDRLEQPALPQVVPAFSRR